jgi:hypothetical protein
MFGVQAATRIVALLADGLYGWCALWSMPLQLPDMVLACVTGVMGTCT